MGLVDYLTQVEVARTEQARNSPLLFAFGEFVRFVASGALMFLLLDAFAVPFLTGQPRERLVFLAVVALFAIPLQLWRRKKWRVTT